MWQLFESLGVDELKHFNTRSPLVMRNMIITLSDIIKEDLVEKIKKSGGFAILADEATDISNIQQLLTFVRYYDTEKKITSTSFVNSSNILAESETSAPNAESLLCSLRNLIVNDLSLDINELRAFCSDVTRVMTHAKNVLCQWIVSF